MGAACAENPSELESYLIKYGSRNNTHGELIDMHYEGFMVIPDKAARKNNCRIFCELW